MRIGHVELFVRDPLAAREFYVEVLGAEAGPVHDVFAWVELGGVEILLRPGAPPAGGDEYGGARAALVLYTRNLDATREALASRGLEFRGTDGSENCLTFTDPDGNWFQLVDPGEP